MVIFISILTLLLIGIVLIAVRDNKDNALYSEEVKRLFNLYKAALDGKDRKVALQAGRAYYSFARKGGPPTASDEQTMANDLSTMPLEVFLGETTETTVRDTALPGITVSN
ncbi:MAG: hypothetical protein DI535_14260 [Citrobacter freundii]|nr:MAG: hypothetical protein DI535_14260 [Citrobacter freundii]